MDFEHGVMIRSNILCVLNNSRIGYIFFRETQQKCYYMAVIAGRNDLY